MNRSKKQQQVMSAVPMQWLGINTVVLTQQERLERLRQEYLCKPDHVWMNGRGKRYMRDQLAATLKAEDEYFDRNLPLAVEGNQHWDDFIDNCVIYAVLCSVLDDKPLVLLHPSCWERTIKKCGNRRVRSDRPTLIKGVASIL